MNLVKLVYDKDVNSFETIAKIKGDSVEITLNDFLNSQENEAIELSTRILVWLDGNLEKSKAYAASKILSIRNEYLRSEKRIQLQLADYVKNLKLGGINAFSDERFSLYFDDNLSEDDYIVVDIGNDFSFGDVYTE
ncbi:MAG: DUF2262 domain-containing protein [Chitinophagaceae bacterium]|nr:DUF2262 domain-containing protein [Chitinophagaceae bacterium]